MKAINLDQINGFSKYEIRAKLNGIFAKWDGERLLTKTGQEIMSAPHISSGLIGVSPVEGEIYLHGMPFQKINQIAMQGFDTDQALEFFPHAEIEVHSATTRNEFDSLYQEILADGYEGVVLTDKTTGERFKHKPRYDMEAVIIGFNPGTGKNKKTFGSLKLETISGEIFNCSGISKYDRERLWNDQAIGETITVSYLSLSQRGVPISPSFEDYRWDDPIIKNSGHGGARHSAGRKPKKLSEKRSIKKMYRWTEAEHKAIRKAAAEMGIKESEFVRKAVLNFISQGE